MNFNDIELYVYIIGFVIIVLIILGLFFIIRKPKKTTHQDVSVIVDSFGEDNIKHIEFKRNKINIVTINHQKVDYDKLKESGVIGINIVGDTVKFYFEKDNEEIFNALQAELER